MRPRTYSIALTLLGFTAGAAVVYALDHLPSVKLGPEAGQQTQEAVPEAPPGIRLESAPGFADAVAAAAPAVVKVYAAGAAPDRARTSSQSRSKPLALIRADRPFNQAPTRLGSGVIIGSQGLIVTNGHVVRDRDQIRIELHDGRTLAAELLGIDNATDLAVLRAPLPGVEPISLGDPSSLRVGDVVLAIGNPYDIGQTVSLGIVSATARSRLGLTEIEDFIQTDAAINPGNSGGALVDTAGRLVGIATSGLSQSGHSEGVGFAIASTLVMQVVEAIADHSQADQGWIGLGGRSVTQDLEQRFGLQVSSGVLISSLVENGPAAAAGLRAGDVITSFAGHEVTDSFQLRELIAATAPQREAPLILWRGSERIEATVRAMDGAADHHSDVASAQPNPSDEPSANAHQQAQLDINGAGYHE